jgi:DNA-binding response OmpR family regulator
MSDKSHISLLVVDDEPGMRDMLCYELQGQGFKVSVAEDGEKALELIRKQTFDLVISDFKMPKMDGMKLLAHIKEINPAIEVIIATGNGTIEDAVVAMKNGAYDFILKPFNLEELAAMIEKALEKKSLKVIVALYESSKAVFSEVELEKLLGIILGLTQSVLHADEASLMLLEKDDKLRIVASRGLATDVIKEAQIGLGERVAGLVAKEKQPRLLIDGLSKYPEFKGLKDNSRIHSSIVCPLICQAELVGVLNLNRTKSLENFTPEDLNHASIFAAQAALAIHNAQLFKNLQEANRKLEENASLKNN